MFSYFFLPLILMLVVSLLFYLKNKNKNSFWEYRGVICTNEQIEAKWGKESIHDVSLRLYREFQNSPFFGSWSATNEPCLVIRDIELIKAIFIKKFDHFSTAHHMVPAYEKMLHEKSKKHEKLILKNLQTAHGDEWKNLRATFSPIFKPEKLKELRPTISQISEKMNNYVSGFAETKKEFEIREITGRYSLDCLANCVFGFRTDSFEDENSTLLQHFNGFFQTVSDKNDDKTLSCTKKLIRFLKDFKIHLDFKLPNFIKAFLESLGLNIFLHFQANEHAMYLMQAVERLPKCRSPGGHGNNFISMMIEETENPSKYTKENDLDQYEKDAKILGNYPRDDGTIPKASRDDVISTALLMLSAGYDTTGTAMAYVLYDLANNPECQTKLFEEIQTEKSFDKMPYLDAVIQESMRKHPILANLERICTEDYPIEGLDGLPYTINKGEMIRVSNVGICLDPDIFPKPKLFDPDRFLNDDEKEEEWSKRIYKNKNPLAFSLGPRNCFAMKFAMLEMKLGIVGLIKHFKFLPGDNNQNEMVWNKMSIIGLADGELWIKCKRR